MRSWSDCCSWAHQTSVCSFILSHEGFHWHRYIVGHRTWTNSWWSSGTAHWWCWWAESLYLPVEGHGHRIHQENVGGVWWDGNLCLLVSLWIIVDHVWYGLEQWTVSVGNRHLDTSADSYPTWTHRVLRHVPQLFDSYCEYSWGTSHLPDIHNIL